MTGIGSKACGALGCWLVLTERGEWDGETYPIKEVKAVRVDGKIIKPNTWYKLREGQIIETD
nr:MAG TPA: thiamine-biosynthesis protein [Caudoviricetes sp.]